MTMWRRHMSLLIVIRPSDGDVKPPDPLVLHAGTGFHLLPLSYPLSSLTSYYTTRTIKHYTHTHRPIHTLTHRSISWSRKPGLSALGISVILTILPPVNSVLWQQPLGKPWPTSGF
ncbi:hypothetical protein C0J52_12932 [Blattella germanica]|nr:hypothetical protein C0J52_12932 [Blattella germanica]